MTVELSNCCDALMQGEPSNNFMSGSEEIEGRCADCKEMAVFTPEDEERA